MFADINCSLAVRHDNDDLSYFNSKEQLHDVFSGLVPEPETDQ